MTSKIIFSILIVTFIISEASAFLRGDGNAVCTKAVRKSEILSSSGLYYRENEEDVSSTLRIRRIFRTLYHPAWPAHEICCPGYENNNGTCEPRCLSQCKNGHCPQPEICVCNDGFRESLRGNVSVCELIPEISRVERSPDDDNNCTSCCVSGNCMNGTNSTCNCDVGYEKSNVSCNCSFGTCKALDTCICDYGWAGNSCDEPTLCFVAQPITINSIDTKSNLTESNSTDVTTENPIINLNLPACSLDCLDQIIGTIHVNSTRKALNVTYHYIPIDSRCNITVPEIDSVTGYKKVISAVSGVVLIVMIVFVAYIVTRHIERRNRFLNDSMQCSYTNYERINLISLLQD